MRPIREASWSVLTPERLPSGRALEPAIERCRLDEQQLAAGHDLHKGLYVALEVSDAHAE